MDRKKTELAGICGIFCGTCPSYLAPLQGDRERLEKIAQEEGRAVEEVVCQGCLSDKVAASCRDCDHGFRACAAEHGVTWCFECGEFPCGRLEDFLGVHVVNGIVHHERSIEHLEFMKKHGVEAWVDKEDQAGRCPRCREMVYWSARSCPNCGKEIR